MSALTEGTHLTRHTESVAELSFACPKFAEDLGYGSRLNSAFEELVELFRAGGQVNEAIALLVILCRGGESHRDELLR